MKDHVNSYQYIKFFYDYITLILKLNYKYQKRKTNSNPHPKDPIKEKVKKLQIKRKVF